MNRFLRAVTVQLFLCCGLAFAAMAAHAAEEPPAVDIGLAFARGFADWQAWANEQPVETSLTEGPAFKAMATLGAAAAPLCAEKLVAAASPREGAALAEALARMMLKRLPKSALPMGEIADPAAKAAAYLQWWTDGRPATRAEFDTLYARWQVTKAKGDFTLTRDTFGTVYDDVQKKIVTRKEQQRTTLLQIYTDLKNMGIDILPLLIEKFRAKDYDLLPLFSEIVRYNGKDADPPDKRAQALLTWWEKHQGQWTVDIPVRARNSGKVPGNDA